jgi:uridylate kinase
MAITDVDPIEWRIPLARFLNPFRDDLPDVDIDVPRHRQELAMQRIFDAWPGKTARISNYVMYKERSARREAAKRLGAKGRLPRDIDYAKLGVDPDVVADIARQISEVVKTGTEVSIVIGGGNYFRGAQLSERGMDRARADYMGMLGTVMNCLALQDFLEKQGIDTRVQTAIPMSQVAEPYVPRRAARHLEKGRVVIFGAGLGVPFFSTDSSAAQRALEIGAQVVLMAKGVDGVYDSDPRTNPNAKFYETLSHDEVLAQNLKVADATAISLCRDNRLPIVVFNLLVDGNIARAVRGERIGTLISTN